MKGGVTSGVVYPSAVSAIASRYRLRSIGGTSAGAIAAAAAAAMEFGRTSGRNPEAPAQLEQIPAELGVKQDGKPLLMRLFEPDPRARKLFESVLEVQRYAAERNWLGLGAKIAGPSVVIGTLVSVLLLALLLALGAGGPGIAQILLAVLVFILLAAGVSLAHAIFRWGRLLVRGLGAASDAGFGFCSGMNGHQTEGAPPAPSLGDWLHGKIQSLAGLPEAEPLCFGDLWIADHRAEGRNRAAAFEAAAAEHSLPTGAATSIATLPRTIDLALDASDITRAQSIEFPFTRREDRLYAHLGDLRDLYPPSIVEWMTAHAGTKELDGVDLGAMSKADLIRLPPPEDLPVLFAVRPSLSFPILFRAVRIYLVRRKEGGTQILSPLWLADGGITSNFPIHLFDAPIPTRPTFCINLLYADDEVQPDERPGPAGEPAEKDEGLSSDPDAPADDLVYMLRTNWGRLAPYTALPTGGIGGLLPFATRVISTARQWNDNQLLDVPGYRDRIVHVRMREGEGGFNLDMESGAIADLQKRGKRAGDLIARRFLPGD